MNWELIGKLGGGEVQVYPVSVVSPRSSSRDPAELFRPAGEEGEELLVILKGQYEASSTSTSRQIEFWAGEREPVRLSSSDRGGYVSLALKAHPGEAIWVKVNATASSFIGSALVIRDPGVPTLSEGETEKYEVSVEGLTGTHTTHTLLELSQGTGEIRHVEVDGEFFSVDGTPTTDNRPTVIIGSSESDLISVPSSGILHSGYITAQNGMVGVVSNSSTEVGFRGVISVTKMKT